MHRQAARQCGHVAVIMFVNGEDELRVLAVGRDDTLTIRLVEAVVGYWNWHTLAKKNTSDE